MTTAELILAILGSVETFILSILGIIYGQSKIKDKKIEKAIRKAVAELATDKDKK